MGDVTGQGRLDQEPGGMPEAGAAGETAIGSDQVPANPYERFPEMKRVSGPPTLFTLNTVGFSMFGKRDWDEATGTYVSTWCFTVLFIPLIPIRAYRVMRLGNQWAFLGRVPLSALTKLWLQVLVGLLLIGGGVIWYTAYTQTPEYQARQKMREAAVAAANGREGVAAVTYAGLVMEDRHQAAEATEALRGLLMRKDARLVESKLVFEKAMAVARSNGKLTLGEVANAAIAAAEARASDDRANALAILDEYGGLVESAERVDALRRRLLVEWNKAEPGNVIAATKLAEMQYSEGDLAGARAILEPMAGKLGGGDGARVLGQAYAAEGRLADARRLLDRYVNEQLPAYKAAVKELDAYTDAFWTHQVELLRKDRGPHELYEKLEKANDEERDKLIGEYILQKLRLDDGLRERQETLMKVGPVVSAALDLGMVLLQDSRSQPSTALRDAQLREAEKLFLSLGDLAEDRPDYKLTLAQVYYWLGKQAQGKALLNEVVSKNKDNFTLALSVAEVYRQLGSDADAIRLAKRVYDTAPGQEHKWAAASKMEALASGPEEQVKWLELSDKSEPYNQVKLNIAKARLAFDEGKLEEAESLVRAALAILEKQMPGGLRLNQMALAYSLLHELTGDAEALRRSGDCFEQAAAMNPSDAIAQWNAAITGFSIATDDVFRGGKELAGWRGGGEVQHWSFLYATAGERAALVEAVRRHAGMTKVLAQLDRAMVLAPNSIQPYTNAADVYSMMGDTRSMRDLLARATAAGIDTSKQVAALGEYLDEGRDAEMKEACELRIVIHRKTADELRGAGGLPLAVEMVDLSNQYSRLAGLSLKSDRIEKVIDSAGASVAAAREGHGAKRSSATYGCLQSALMERAAVRLAQADKAFLAYAREHVRSLGLSGVVATAIAEGGEFKAKLIADSDVMEAAALAAEESRELGRWSSFDWAVFGEVDPALKQTAAAWLKGDECGMLAARLDHRLGAYAGSGLLDLYWRLEIEGKADEAKAIARQSNRLGVKLPASMLR